MFFLELKDFDAKGKRIQDELHRHAQEKYGQLIPFFVERVCLPKKAFCFFIKFSQGCFLSHQAFRHCDEPPSEIRSLEVGKHGTKRFL